MAKKKVGVIYAYDFALRELRPMLELEINEDVLSQFVSHSLLIEEAKKSVKEEAEVLAEAKKPAGERLTLEKGSKAASKTYSLTYYNPVTHKAEVIENKIDIRIKDYTTRMIEESVGINSSYPLYTYIATPLIRTKVVPWLLEDILKEREYGTPPEFSGGAAIKIPKKAKKSEIIAIKKQAEAAREAVVEALVRKEESERKIDEEIVVFEDVVKSIRKGTSMKKAIEKLPPLSRARYIVALKKKKLQKALILELLLQDVKFLKSVKKKIETLTIDGLLGLIKALKKMKNKG